MGKQNERHDLVSGYIESGRSRQWLAAGFVITGVLGLGYARLLNVVDPDGTSEKLTYGVSVLLILMAVLVLMPAAARDEQESFTKYDTSAKSRKQPIP